MRHNVPPPYVGDHTPLPSYQEEMLDALERRLIAIQHKADLSMALRVGTDLYVLRLLVREWRRQHQGEQADEPDV